MKILLIGGSGNIGRAIRAELSGRHEIIVAGRSHGDVRVDIEDERSIVEMYSRLPRLDAVAVATGGRNGHVAPLAEMSAERYRVGLESKLLGQVNAVLHGVGQLADGGSFTLVGGAWQPQAIVPKISNVYMANAALEAFVNAAAVELPRGLRINLVSPLLLTESEAEYGPLFRGVPLVDARSVARAYSLSVEGAQTGQTYRLGQLD
ncbi:short chain dehydrogenase [Chromobacterium subtsugae]|uniref:Short chain dehydrogenase n=1 Tax=Chromobacterium subtsugae TaxID=251747 RepID=A0ABS7FL98_9NEIS|nr:MULTISPECIES: short chain dehydrogenase [Chromobacterium]KUM02237.1 short-chain dehydrogenase [Chromobacterium subtsugae]KZE86192.1 short-chain dehydrogenase [Chromobacterium sp. F49]MBW7568039.1 short chain dehydrogenase [Chromobacterium subtsugae]MBW8290079.1 short chain dehydrogenase [Chromobacterium subtsugae]WSE91951.1 short chain dehydrogenase [Chromobacterium subtsugae]